MAVQGSKDALVFNFNYIDDAELYGGNLITWFLKRASQDNMIILFY